MKNEAYFKSLPVITKNKHLNETIGAGAIDLIVDVVYDDELDQAYRVSYKTREYSQAPYIQEYEDTKWGAWKKFES